MLSYKSQKYIFILILILLNSILSFGILFAPNYWYIYILILAPSSILNVWMILNLIIASPTSLLKKKELIYNKKNILFIIPCYNESYDELLETIESFYNQMQIHNHDKILTIVCDGKVHGKGNPYSTDKILVDDILKNYITEEKAIANAYLTWENKYNDVQLHSGLYKNKLPFILIIKENNVGKRDSLTITRGVCYKFNEKLSNTYTLLDSYLIKFFLNNNINRIDAILGTDGDTVLDLNCAYNLIQSLFGYRNTNLMGVCGFVKISPYMNKWSFWTIYQHTEYIYAQVTKRLHQSKFTEKVSCLPGCVQILRVSKETCGTEILNEFNRMPKSNELIHRQIRSYASEDRNHVCLMLHMYPYVITKQSLTAVAYTKIPNNFTVYLSQRRRWSLGATFNDVILATRSGVQFFERIVAFTNIVAWYFNLFILVATIHLIILISKMQSFTFNNIIDEISIYLIIIIIVLPMIYLLFVPMWIKLEKYEIVQLYIGIIFWYIINIPMVGLIHVYTLFNMDNFSWGKTREVANNNELNEILIDNEN